VAWTGCKSEQAKHFCFLNRPFRRVWLACWILCFEEQLSWLPIPALPDLSVMEHQEKWKAEQRRKEQHSKSKGRKRRNKEHSNHASLPSHYMREDAVPSGTHLFAKPRHFASVLHGQLITRFDDVSRVNHPSFFQKRAQYIVNPF